MQDGAVWRLPNWPGVAFWALLLVSAPLQAATWRSFSTSEFEVIGDASLREMREAASAIEVYRFALQKTLPWLSKPGPVRPRLFVLAHNTFRTYVQPQTSIAGFTVPDEFDCDIVVDANASEWMAASRIAMHELTHYYLHTNATTVLPSWFDEGLAELLSTVQKKGDVIQIGTPAADRWLSLQLLPWMPLADFISVRMTAHGGETSEKTSAFYAQAWLILHQSFIEQPTRLPQVLRMLQLQTAGFGARDALQAALGDNLADYERELMTLSHAKSVRVGNLPAPAISAESAPPTEISDAQGLTELALLMLRLSRGPEQLEPLLRRALKGGADDRAAAALALTATALERSDAAQLQQDCERSASSALAVRLCGDAMLVQPIHRSLPGHEDTVPPERVHRARILFARAADADPERFDALFHESMTYALLPDNAAEMIPRLTSAIERRPRSWKLRAQLARIYQADGQLEKSKAEIEFISLHTPEMQIRDWAIRTLRDIDDALAAKTSKAPAKQPPARH